MSDKVKSIIWWAVFFAMLITLITSWVTRAHAVDLMVASWYGPGFWGNPTASGEIYKPGFTAAHKTMPLGTNLLVCANAKCAKVKVNDRGPYIKGRELDLNRAVAAYLGIVDEGVATVNVIKLKKTGVTYGPRLGCL